MTTKRSYLRRGSADAPRRVPVTLTAGVVALALALVSACGVPEDQTDRPVNRADVQFGLLDPVVTTTSTTTTTTRLPPSSIPATTTTTTTAPAYWLDLYLIQNQRLVRVRRPTPVEATVDAVLAALQNPTFEETLGGRRSELTDPGLIVSATSGGGTAAVELGDPFSLLLGSNQQLAIGQIVYSLTEVTGIGNVAFSLGGSPLEVPGMDGRLIRGPISRDDLLSLVASPTSTTSTIYLPPR